MQQRSVNSLWGAGSARLSAMMLAADPMLDGDPLALLAELLKNYRNDELVFDLWATAHAVKGAYGW